MISHCCVAQSVALSLTPPRFPNGSLRSDVLLPDGSSANLIDFLLLHLEKGSCCFLFFESCGVRDIFHFRRFRESYTWKCQSESRQQNRAVANEILSLAINLPLDIHDWLLIERKCHYLRYISCAGESELYNITGHDRLQ